MTLKKIVSEGYYVREICRMRFRGDSEPVRFSERAKKILQEHHDFVSSIQDKLSEYIQLAEIKRSPGYHADIERFERYWFGYDTSVPGLNLQIIQNYVTPPPRIVSAEAVLSYLEGSSEEGLQQIRTAILDSGFNKVK